MIHRIFVFVQIIAAMIVFFVVSWLPYAIVAQLGIFGFEEHVTPYAAELPVMLAKASAVWNPIVYALSQARYKTAVVRLLPAYVTRICCRKSLRTTSIRLRFVQPTTF